MKNEKKMSQNNIICKSEYICLRDGTRLAISVWLDEDILQTEAKKYPAMVTTTRYWRATSHHDDQAGHQFFYPAAAYYYSKGYVFVAVDARGTGASFGCRDTEMSPTEIDDIGDIVDWLSRQAWCDGRVVTEGTSYTASTALYGLVTASSALTLAICRAPDFDGYRHLLAPGGIVNDWFIGSWGPTTAALDNNDVEALVAEGYMQPPSSGVQNLIGVRPVDEDRDGSLLAMALSEHKANFNLTGYEDSIDCSDNIIYEKHRVLFDPDYQNKIEASGIPMIIRCGWHDAGTQLGALAMFATFKAPIRVIIDPWNHSGNGRADPFYKGDGTTAGERPLEKLWASTVELLDERLTLESNNLHQPTSKSLPRRLVEYYTLGENCWKTTEIWPLPQTRKQRWYMAEDNQLNIQPSISSHGSDLYQVDPSATTGCDNRWFAQAPRKPVLFPDRQEEDKKLLVYDTPVLDTDVEITGHPVVSLQLRSSATDGQIFVYLETIDPDGRVRMLTEGQLRAINHKVSDEKPPYVMFGPYHSLKRKDQQLLVPDEVTEITFDLFPISVLLKKGQRIRLAIAGADKDTFAAIPGCEKPLMTLERNSLYRSYIELPIIPKTNVVTARNTE